MKKIVLFLLKIIIFFEAFFITQRLFFLFYNFEKIKDNTIFNILLSNIYGIPLDVSTIGYFMLITLMLIMTGVKLQQAFCIKIINVLFILFIVLCSLINIFDTALVSTWGTKINAKALSYVFYPELMTQAFLTVNYMVLISWFVVSTAIFIFLYHQYIRLKPRYEVKGIKNLLFIPLLFLIFTFMRGGWGNNPIGKSRGVYSDNPTLNLATVNGFWNMMSLYEKKDEKVLYQFFELPVAEETFRQYIIPVKDTTIQILTNQRPNIVMILLESFSAENMMSLGGSEPIAPCLDSIAREGLLFTSFYATGSRTEQGLVALLSGFPAQPQFSIQRESGKVFKLPMLTTILKNNGYELNFFYTGDLAYARTNEYLKIGLFDHVYGDQDFQHVERTNSGAYDEYLFQFQIEKSKASKIPFFTLFLTSSSHEPCNGKFKKIFKDDTPSSKYKNAIHYTDSCLLEYLNEAKQQSWYANTLFIIMADHANTHPNNRDYNEPLRFKIPLLLMGDVLKTQYKGKIFSLPAGQPDFPSTILSQLNLKNGHFEFSKNIFNPYCNHFAFYTFDNGFGIIDPHQTVVYDCDKKQVLSKISTAGIQDTTLLNRGKSILQVMMQRFSEME